MDTRVITHSLVGSALLLAATSGAQAAVVDIASLLMDSTELELVYNGTTHTFSTTDPVEITFDTPATFVTLTDSLSHSATIYSIGSLSGQADGGAGALVNMDLAALKADFDLGADGPLTIDLWDSTTVEGANTYDETDHSFTYGWTTDVPGGSDHHMSMCMGGRRCGGSTTSNSTTAELQGTVNPVPLPAAAWLFGAGLLGIAGMTRRKTS